MNSQSVDLLYLDPPFNSKRDYAAPIGSEAAGAEFKDTWALSDIDNEWVNLIAEKHPALHRVLLAATTKSDKSYLVYMAARMLEMHRLLKPTGSIYLHCDPTMSHYLKLVMDAIFGRKNFRREIIWHLRGASGFKSLTQNWVRGHDVILYYAITKDVTFNKQWLDYDEAQMKRFSKVDNYGRKYKPITKTRRLYLDEAKGVPATSVWSDIASFQTVINSPERLGYPTQKPLKLLERIISASSHENDMVLDPFCGCATAPVAAELLGRQWVGIDIAPKAADLVQYRLNRGEVGEVLYKPILRDDLPQRTDLGTLPKYNSLQNKKYLYGEQDGYCAGCKDHFQVQHLEVDHIISRNKGGTDHIANLQLLCGNCNRIKGDRGMGYLRIQLQL
ncbi:MAG: HNH endonuclease [Cellvibrionales bacterium]|nr:HNH endonuclease [Cellvibrionales bacterium]